MEKRYSLTETAQLIRKALKEAFPRTRFSVRSKSYAGGCSIDARWADGPTERQVNRILKCFEQCGFDPMQDLKTYNENSEWHGQEVSFGADYVFGHRSLSVRALRDAALFVADECGLPLLHIEPTGYTKDGNERVPFRLYVPDAREGQITICSDPHDGESYQQLVYQVAHHTSYEATGRADLPVYQSEDYINETVARMVQ